MTKIVPFLFGETLVRVADREDAPWFVAKDVCEALGLGPAEGALRKLDPEEKGATSIRTLGGTQDMLVVSESGLYALALRCRDAMTPGSTAHRFRKWVTAEVLPSIRKTGAYLPADVVAKIDRIFGIERMLSHKVTEIERVAHEIKAMRTEDALNADSRRSAVMYASALTLVEEAGAVQKGRRSLVARVSRALKDLDRDEAHRVRCGTTGTWLFHRSFAKNFMRHVGNAWVAEHNANASGQQRLRLVA